MGANAGVWGGVPSSHQRPIGAVVALGLGGLCKRFGGPFPMRNTRKSFGPFHAKIVVTAKYFVRITILTGTTTSIPNYPG